MYKLASWIWQNCFHFDVLGHREWSGWAISLEHSPFRWDLPSSVVLAAHIGSRCWVQPMNVSTNNEHLEATDDQAQRIVVMPSPLVTQSLRKSVEASERDCLIYMRTSLHVYIQNNNSLWRTMEQIGKHLFLFVSGERGPPAGRGWELLKQSCAR